MWPLLSLYAVMFSILLIIEIYMSPILIMYHTVPLPGWVIWIFVSTLPYRGFSARLVSPLLTHWRYCSFALSHRCHIHDQTVENLRSLWHKLILPWHCEAHQHWKQSPISFKLHAYKCKIINLIMKPNLYIPIFVEFAFFFFFFKAIYWYRPTREITTNISSHCEVVALSR